MTTFVGFTRLFVFLVAASSFRSSCADTGQYWHVTDFHYDHTYGGRGLSCNEEVDMSGVFGDYWCDSPWRLVQDSVDSMAKIMPDPDFILWTGDTVAHIKDPFLNIETNVEILKNITTHLSEAFPNVPMFVSLGNHDFYPSDHAEAWYGQFYSRVAEVWAPFIGEENNQTGLFKKGGYYSRNLTDGIRILCMNTNLYYQSNPLTKNLTDPAEQFQWMRDQLDEIRAKGMKAIVTAHIPPGPLTPDVTDWMYPNFREAMVDIMTAFSDVIVSSHFGHDHVDSFKVLQKENGSQAVAHFTAPSVTPWRFKIPGLTGKAHNPAVRLISYDRDSGLHLDYAQYFINLTDSNENNRTQWSILYNFTEAYGVPDMSADSVKKALDKMKTWGSIYAEKFCQYNLVSDFPQECTLEQRAGIYCGGLYNNVDVARRCRDELVEDFQSQGGGGGSGGGAVGLAASVTWLVTSLLLARFCMRP